MSDLGSCQWIKWLHGSLYNRTWTILPITCAQQEYSELAVPDQSRYTSTVFNLHKIDLREHLKNISERPTSNIRDFDSSYRATSTCEKFICIFLMKFHVYCLTVYIDNHAPAYGPVYSLCIFWFQEISIVARRRVIAES